MMSLQEVTERMIRQNPGDELEHSLLQGLPGRIFGEVVAEQIREMRIEGDTLLLSVADPVWRRELQKRRLTLLARAKSLRPAFAESS